MVKIETVSKTSNRHLPRDSFATLKATARIHMGHAEYSKVPEVVSRTIVLSVAIDASAGVDLEPGRPTAIIGTALDKINISFALFHTNFDKFITVAIRSLFSFVPVTLPKYSTVIVAIYR